MNKYQEAWERINSVLNSNLLFSEWLENKSNWGSYLNETNEVGAELKFDDDMNVIQKLIDERIEFESRKDKLIIGSEWECIIRYHHYPGEIGKRVIIKEANKYSVITNYKFNEYITIDLPIEIFLYCHKPIKKGE